MGRPVIWAAAPVEEAALAAEPVAEAAREEASDWMLWVAEARAPLAELWADTRADEAEAAMEEASLRSEEAALEAEPATLEAEPARLPVAEAPAPEAVARPEVRMGRAAGTEPETAAPVHCFVAQETACAASSGPHAWAEQSRMP